MSLLCQSAERWGLYAHAIMTNYRWMILCSSASKYSLLLILYLLDNIPVVVVGFLFVGRMGGS